MNTAMFLRAVSLREPKLDTISCEPKPLLV
jgi:hypothetical protein